MSRTYFVGLLATLYIVASASAQTKTAAYAPADGGFQIRLPGKPKESTQTANSPIGDLKVFTATYATSDGNAYLISYTDFPAGATRPENRGTLFDGVRDGLKTGGAKVVSEKDVEVGPDKVPGRDIDIETDKGKKRVKYRVVLRDSRLYQVAALGTPAFVAGKDAVAYFESFELTK